RNGWEIDPAWMLFSPGVMPTVRAAILAFSEPGDEVIIQPPVYFPFFDAIRDNGRVVVENPLREVSPGGHEDAGRTTSPPDPARCSGVRYEMDLDGLESAITPRTRMIILCSPHNPVGRVWSADELRGLAAVAERHDLIVVADEIHSDITRTGVEFVPYATLGGEATSRAVICNSPTKTFNIAGLSSSHAIVPDPDRRSRLEATFGRLGLTLPNVLALEAARAAYAEGTTWTDELLAFLDEQIGYVASEVIGRFGEGADARVRLSPIEGTYLAWLDLRTVMERSGASHHEVNRTLLEDEALWLSEGRHFGTQGDGFFRMNLATQRSRVNDGLDRLERAVARLEDR
ncbi:MAG: MalY/PatB family protein, partial [Spirochaetota bacterium]